MPAALAMSTPDGIVLMSQWSHCAAAQSSFIRQCAQMICNNTRPNDTDDYAKEVGATTMTACNAARESGVEPPNGSCKKPLTRYEAEYVAHMVCFASDRSVLGGTGAGASTPETILQNDRCAQTLTRWKQQKQQEMVNLVRGMAAMQKLKSCWPDGSLRPAIKQD
jgi:hypothetical protein